MSKNMFFHFFYQKDAIFRVSNNIKFNRKILQQSIMLPLTISKKTLYQNYIYSFFSVLNFLRIFLDFFKPIRNNFLVPLYSTYQITQIARIRFRPGYIRIWKYAREELQVLWNLKFPYTKRLTKLISRLKLFLYRSVTTQLNYLFTINSSFLVFLIKETDGLWINGFWYNSTWTSLIPLNGDFIHINITPIVYLFLYKCLQLFQYINFTTFVIFRKLINNIYKRRWKSKFIKIFFFNVFYFVNTYLFEDVSSLSFFFFNLNNKILPITTLRPSVWNLYNWKYIT